MNESVVERCQRLRALHTPGAPLVLPNAWDAATARAVVSAGFPAVATTSAGVAAALGYDDHEAAPPDEMLAAAARIIGSTPTVPVTIDLEAGYGLSPDDLARQLIEIGCAGINLEDTDHSTHALVPVEAHAARLAAVREATDTLGYPLVINARIDVFLVGTQSDPVELLEHAILRARAYFAAGADCVYPIFLSDAAQTRRFLAGAEGPVNLLAPPDPTAIARLTADGAARISCGPHVFWSAMTHVADQLARIAS